MKPRRELGIYRQQIIGRNPHHYAAGSRTGRCARFEIILASKDPSQSQSLWAPTGHHARGGHADPDTLSEYQFAGLLRGARTELVKCLGSTWTFPRARRSCSKDDRPRRCRAGRPHGDHTGYYNEAERL